ncbi:LytR/AlgR family response regulator transcription factor [Parabacteroides sp. FAFU027]|uniref:LytR/AlgR family response regulator transcription factor n=1 Tax=Parabacteroides sp. FAFU027 TaxID=2922715 RepID=UPI001FAED105|nr:response regulator transcription factor [Parabacteroides sp. FAFU027]
MITAIILDTDTTKECIANLISNYFESQIKLYEVATTVLCGVELIKTNNPDIVFLNADLEEESNCFLNDYFKDTLDFEIVIMANSKRHAFNAIKRNAFDYLIKPINKIDILSIVKKYERKLSEKQIGTTHHFPVYPKILPKIPLATSNGIKYIEEFIFLYAKADGAYCEVYTIDCKKITLSKTLKEFEALASRNNFYRSHKSYLINLAHVCELVENDGIIILKNNQKIPLSKSRKEVFLSRMANNSIQI